ncbi:MAG: hypothetical protein ACKVRN_02625 [Pyrinomonadaceae bacterium]
MKNSFFAFTAIAVLLFNLVAFAAVDTRRVKPLNPQVSRLVAMLPASDMVAVFDTKRFIDDAMPKLLSANQPMLSEAMRAITEMETRAGIDIRKFEQVVIGASMKPGVGKKVDGDFVALAGGDINAGALVAMAKLASKGKYREEKVGETPVYVFQMKKPATKPAPGKTARNKTSKVTSTIDSMKSFDSEMAVAAIGQNTIAVGTIEKVRETIEAKSRVGTDLTDLLATRETAVMSFAAKVPAGPVGMSNFFPLDNDELGSTINSIQYMSGSLDVAQAGTSLQLMARTAKPEQALALKDTLEALQILGKGFLGNSKRPDQQVFGRMVKNAKIASQANDVTLDLTVPQADIDVLVARIK